MTREDWYDVPSDEMTLEQARQAIKDLRKKLMEYLEQEPTTQEHQAESDRFDAAFQDGYNNGYTQARFDYEQEPTTKNDLGVDCISRDDVCRYVAEFVNHEFSTREEEELIDNIITGIEHMPSVTPQEPRKGHWILCMPGGAEEWCYKCSECNFWKYKKTINLSKFKFCPNCGSRNEVEE